MIPRRPLADALLALPIGVAAFYVSCLVEAPGARSFSFGLTYEAMTAAPLEFTGLFPHRVLLPLLANVLGLDGANFFRVSHGTAVLLLVLVCWGARRLRCSWLDAALLTLATALGGATQLYKSHVGYPDSLSFSLLLASVFAVRSRGWSWGLLLLGALAHEQVLFFAPLLLWLRRKLANADWAPELLAAGATALVYAGFRAYVHAQATADLEPKYYFTNGYFPLGFLGVLYLVFVQVVLVFGLQLVSLPRAYRHPIESVPAGPGWQRVALWLTLAGIVGIYAVAHDFNRFVNFLFLPLLLSLREFLRLPRGRWLLLGALAVQVVVTRHVVMPVTHHFAAPMFEHHVLTGDPSRLPMLVTHVLPRVWPAVAVAIATVLALLWLGRWIARRTPPDAVGGV